ncbi:uncharacterized protein K02A2.6-like [Achroia grisella]|uniref:uncharacterized protein K02A2.6-like n=1 Tax=Achroia grisella TaxID=688607 RepID=UPI0027D21F33|nr:uncharacterized protein K02A2.6-like [Achroia grisella]
MPTANEIFALLAGGRLFTTLDLDRAYTQVPVDEQTSKLMTLNTTKGLFSVHRLAFGVKASPGIFQRAMTALLADVPGVAVLLDDIIITGHTLDEMKTRLNIVLQRLTNKGLKLKQNKCKFGKTQVEFLGFLIDAEGIHPAKSKINAIINTPPPRNVQQLQAFLGLYNFYERFVPHKATVLEPLHRLLDQKQDWKWSKEEQQSFNTAKSLLANDVCLTHYDTKKKLILTCDSSDYGVGAVLAHIMANGDEKPIAMGSRTLHPHERRYSQLDKEATAILFGIKKFNNYLMGRRFTIITDHKPLLGIFGTKKKIPDILSPRLTRICLTLAAHDYEIEYKRGKEISNADGLSRWPMPVLSQDIDTPGEVLLIAETPHDLPFGPKDIERATSGDPTLHRVKWFILKGWPARITDKELHTYWLHRLELSIQDGCILLGSRVVLPNKLREDMLKLLHQTHNGIVHTKALARSYVWWPQMDRDIEKMISNCHSCLENRNMPTRSSHEWIMPARPWSRIHVDFAGPFQNKIFLIVVDSYSKWPEVHIVNSMASSIVIKHLRYIFAQHGLCETLVSDNGTSFVSKDFEDFLVANKIKHIRTAPYHPATNGQAERMVQTLKNKLKKMTDVPWEVKLPRILLTLRSTPCTSTKRSPAELLMNRQLRTLLDTVHPNINHYRKTENQIIDNANRKNRETQVGKKVMYRNYAEGEKWKSGTIIGKEGPSSYRIETENGECMHRHIDQLVTLKDTETEELRTQGTESEIQEQVAEVEQELTNENLGEDQTWETVQEQDIIEIPSCDQWADMLGIPSTSNVGKIRNKPKGHSKLPYDRL